MGEIAPPEVVTCFAEMTKTTAGASCNFSAFREAETVISSNRFEKESWYSFGWLFSTVKVLLSKSTKETSMGTGKLCRTLRVNCPWTSVTDPLLLSFIITLAPYNGWPSSSKTVQVKCFG